MIKIIGIDPGLAGTGVGIVEGTGIKVDGYSFSSITTSSRIPLPNRLDQIYQKLVGILKAETPDLMVVEEVFSLDKYPKSAIVLGKVAGVVLLAGQQVGMPVTEVPVREAKRILTGNGNASKQQLERAVRRLLNLKTSIRPYHASDAMGLALIGLFRYKQARQARDGMRS